MSAPSETQSNSLSQKPELFNASLSRRRLLKVVGVGAGAAAALGMRAILRDSPVYAGGGDYDGGNHFVGYDNLQPWQKDELKSEIEQYHVDTSELVQEFINPDLLKHHKAKINTPILDFAATSRFGTPSEGYPVSLLYTIDSHIRIGAGNVIIGSGYAEYRVDNNRLVNRGLEIRINNGRKYKDLPPVTISHDKGSTRSIDSVPADKIQIMMKALFNIPRDLPMSEEIGFQDKTDGEDIKFVTWRGINTKGQEVVVSGNSLGMFSIGTSEP